MIRLKQKKAEEEKKIAEEKAAAEIAASENPLTDAVDTISGETASEAPNSSATSSSATGASGLKLFGIGGKSARSTESKVSGKKKSPGEIRIQKGKLNSDFIVWYIDHFLICRQISLIWMEEMSPRVTFLIRMI